MTFAMINRIVFPKMKILALFIYSHVISNMYAVIFSLKYKKVNFEKSHLSPYYVSL